MARYASWLATRTSSLQLQQYYQHLEKNASTARNMTTFLLAPEVWLVLATLTLVVLLALATLALVILLVLAVLVLVMLLPETTVGVASSFQPAS